MQATDHEVCSKTKSMHADMKSMGGKNAAPRWCELCAITDQPSRIVPYTTTGHVTASKHSLRAVLLENEDDGGCCKDLKWIVMKRC